MAALLEAYITNLGKYAEGQLVGETLKFPTTAEEVQSLLKRIGVDGIRYEEIFITSFDGDVLGLHEHLGEYRLPVLGRRGNREKLPCGLYRKRPHGERNPRPHDKLCPYP